MFNDSAKTNALPGGNGFRLSTDVATFDLNILLAAHVQAKQISGRSNTI
jgi:hypothetical protein